MSFKLVPGLSEPGATVVSIRPAPGLRQVVVTYDDGPHPEGTPAVLDVLDEHNVKATFFVLRTRFIRTPSLVRQCVARGHEVGLHGWDHRRSRELSGHERKRYLTDARDELAQLTGEPIRWYRPPYGSQTPETWVDVHDCGMQSVTWSASCGDWRTRTPEAYLDEVAPDLQVGAIVLLHDGFADIDDGADDGSAPDLDRARLTRGLLGLVRERGLTLTSLGRALNEGAQCATRVWLDSAPKASSA